MGNDNDWFANNKYIIILILILLAVISLFPFLEPGLTSSDDIQIALNFRSDKNLSPYASKNETLCKGLGYAVAQGRIFLAISVYLSYVPYLIDNFIYFKIISIGSLVVTIGLFGLVVKKYFENYFFAVLAVAVFLITLQNGWEHSLPSSYPFIFFFGLSMLFISLLLFHKYLKTSRPIYRILSAIVLFFSFIPYELFIPYIAVFGIIAYIYAGSAPMPFKNRFLKSLKTISPHIIAVLIYSVIYFGFRYLFAQTAYYGADISPAKFSVWAFLKVISHYCISSFPAYVFSQYEHIFNAYSEAFNGHHNSIFHIIQNARVDWLIKAGLSSLLFYMILSARPLVFSCKKFCRILLVCVFLMILPVFLPALSAKYQEKALTDSLWKIYTFTHFSFYGTVLFFTTLILYLNQLMAVNKKLSGFYIFALTLFVVPITSLVTDYSNYYIAKSQKQSRLRWETVDLFLKTKEFNSIPDNSVIYAPSLSNYIEQAIPRIDSYWSEYIKIKTGKTVNVIDKESQIKGMIDNGASFYFLKLSQENKEPNQFMVFAKPVRAVYSEGRYHFYSDTADLYSYSKNRKFLLFFSINDAKSPEDIFIDDKFVKRTSERFNILTIDKADLKEPFPHTRITAGEMDLESVSVSYFVDYH